MPVICSPVFTLSEDGILGDHFAGFGFPLSDFQKHAIDAIIEGHHVLVCAPTGSGKTLPAEFAIRHFINQGRRVIYTSPIKALSNQKYHEFSKKFPDITVGLCTGDIKTNPTADLLIMTAEILNNRLFQLQGSSPSASSSSSNLSFNMDIEVELAAVIMDEVHYINDEGRGHVWEQTILSLPANIQMIMLSATLDGPEKFAEWIESTRTLSHPYKKVYLTQTPIRIVPLSHYAYFPNAPLSITKAVKNTQFEHTVKTQTNVLITLQTPQNVFQSTGYKNANKLCELWKDHLHSTVSRKHILNSLATFMKGSDDPDIDDTMLPAIVFTFSRKQVEESANDLTANILAFDSKIPYNAAHECEQILRRLPNWREYIELPEYQSLIRLLEKGVGIHHSGMIPILREIVELRISEKKIFMLFATESFAIGLDCPIRTAVFTGVSKFDGSRDRFLYAHEYTQMAGRAGRRGIDKVGHVVHLPLLFRNGIPSELNYREILSGKPQKLVSKFHIDYKMVLNLIKKGIHFDFHLFAEKSMSKTSIYKEVILQEEQLAKSKQELEKLQNGLKHIRTPIEKCNEYEILLTQYSNSTNKKRKDIERKMNTLKDVYKHMIDDIGLFARVRLMESFILQTENEIEETISYLKTQTDLVCRIMSKLGVINNFGENNTETTIPLGLIASQFAEMHPIPFAKLILEENWFEGWTAKQLVGLLSVFVDVRLPESLRSSSPECKDEKVKKSIIAMQNKYDSIRTLESDLRCYTGIDYEGVLCFDMADAMMEWCELTEEIDCKQFLRDMVAETISAGDFTKACIKLSATAKEIIAMCEVLVPVIGANAMQLAYTLSDVDFLILKHIATTQSLYL
jgi:superfamily II RNA helicase